MGWKQDRGENKEREAGRGLVERLLTGERGRPGGSSRKSKNEEL